MLLAAVAVPLLCRRLLAVAVYSYVRDAESLALAWSDIDLEHGSIHVHQALDRGSGKLVPTKGMQNRRVPRSGARIRPSNRSVGSNYTKLCGGAGN